MKIILLCCDDYANLAHGHAKALQCAGINAECLKLKPHIFGYAEQGRLVTEPQMIGELRKADMVVIYHSHPVPFRIVKDFLQQGGKIIVAAFHSGSIYRDNPEATRKAFDAIGCVLHLTDQCEFLMNGENMQYVTAAIDMQAPIRGLIRNAAPVVFGHFPSNPDVKGTKKIREVMAGIKSDFLCSTERVGHAEQLDRMAGCDVYIELFQPTLNGKPYGCYGVTAFEAAALGKAVVTQNLNVDAYSKAYGVSLPFIICNTEEELRHHLECLSKYSAGELADLQSKTLAWVKKYHILQATGERLKYLLSNYSHFGN